MNAKTMTTIYKYGMKNILHTYRGHIIESFDNAQLLDPELKGNTYSVFANRNSYDVGAAPLNVLEACDKLWQAKMFIDASIQCQAGRR